MFFTKILELCQIDLEGEAKVKMTSKEHEITVRVTNKNLGIFKDKDEIYKHRETASSSARIPEADIKNEVLYNKIFSIENLVTTYFRASP